MHKKSKVSINFRNRLYTQMENAKIPSFFQPFYEQILKSSSTLKEINIEKHTHVAK